mgnify:CR=1 FL=1
MRLEFLHYTIFLIYLTLGLYVIIKSPKEPFNIVIFILFLSLALWSFFSIPFTDPNIDWDTLLLSLHICVQFNFNVSFLTFTAIMIYFNRSNIVKSFPFIALWVLTSSLVFYMQFTGNLAMPQYFNYDIGQWRIVFAKNVWYLISSIAYYSLMIISLVYLLLFYLKSKDKILRRQALLMFIGATIAFVLGYANIIMHDYLSMAVPLMPNAFLVFLAVAIVYSIAKYQLFTLNPATAGYKIFETIPDGLLLANHKKEIVAYNPSLQKMVGKEIKLKKDLEDWLKITTNFKYMLDNIYSKHLRNLHITLTDVEGNRIPVLFSSSLINDEFGRNLGVICIFKDITELKKVEKKLIDINQNLEERVRLRTEELRRAKEKAEASNELKSSFLANMSHEIRTPLNGILGFTNILKEPDLSDDEKLECIALIQKSSDQLLNIINDIIDISKIETGQFEIKLIEIDPKTFIDSEILELNQEAIEKDLTIKNKVNNVPNIIYDESRFSTILRHLISNAIKFTDEGEIEIGATEIPGAIEFYVKDTGIGIPPQYTNEIFERFRQVEHYLTRHHGGTGLGLSITKAIVEEMGGKISVESELGIGSTFYFTIKTIY